MTMVFTDARSTQVEYVSDDEFAVDVRQQALVVGQVVGFITAITQQTSSSTGGTDPRI